jgi:hypothetical protein
MFFCIFRLGEAKRRAARAGPSLGNQAGSKIFPSPPKSGLGIARHRGFSIIFPLSLPYIDLFYSHDPIYLLIFTTGYSKSGSLHTPTSLARLLVLSCLPPERDRVAIFPAID